MFYSGDLFLRPQLLYIGVAISAVKLRHHGRFGQIEAAMTNEKLCPALMTPRDQKAKRIMKDNIFREYLNFGVGALPSEILETTFSFPKF